MWKIRDLDFKNEDELMKAITAVRRVRRNPVVTTNDLTRLRPFLRFIEERPAALKLSPPTVEALRAQEKIVKPPEVMKYYLIENKVVQLFPSQAPKSLTIKYDTAHDAFEAQKNTQMYLLNESPGK